MRINHENTIHPYSLYALGLLYIAVNFGTVFRVFGINVSYFFALLFLAVYLYENKMRIRIPGGSDQRTILLYVVWLTYALVQVLWAHDTALFSQFYQILLINVFLLCATILVVTNTYEFVFAIRAVSLAVWINILAAGWEYFTGNIIVQQKYLLANRQYIAGLIGNFNDFCTFMYIGCCIFLLQLYLSKKFSERLYCIAGIVCAVLIVLFDGARGAIFALICFVPCFFFFLLIDGKRASKRVSRTMIILAVLVVISFVYYVISRNGIYGALAFLDRSGGGDIRSDISRYHMIVKCLEATLDTLGFGVGAGQSILVCGGINVHNFYVEILCEFGVLVFALVTYFSFFIPMKRSDTIPAFVNAITQSFAVTFIIAAVTSSSINKMRMLWIFLALLYVLKEKINLQEEGLFVER